MLWCVRWSCGGTLADYCRVRSSLTSARNHSVRPIDAIHHALTGNPWATHNGNGVTSKPNP
jgi:hypothetical protein